MPDRRLPVVIGPVLNGPVLPVVLPAKPGSYRTVLFLQETELCANPLGQVAGNLQPQAKLAAVDRLLMQQIIQGYGIESGGGCIGNRDGLRRSVQADNAGRFAIPYGIL